MKKISIILAISGFATLMHAQENKNSDQTFSQEKVLNQLKQNEKTTSKTSTSKNAGTKGKVFDGKTSEIAFIRSTLPNSKNRETSKNPNTSKNTVNGLLNPKSLAEIKATIPKTQD